MTFRTYHEDAMYVIQAPEGSKIGAQAEGQGELILFEEMPGGTTVERRLPTSVVVKAARRGILGMVIAERREPIRHPELAPPCPSR